MREFLFNQHWLRIAFCSIILLVSSIVQASEPDELVSSLSNQTSVHVTIYNTNLALVKDTRTVKLNKGINQLAIRGVSAQIRPETALLKSNSFPNALSLVEQNFDFDLLTPQKLLQKYVGKTVRVAKTNPQTGIDKIEQATVLSANNGVVLRIGDRIETGFNGRIIYDNIPDNLRDRPTLVTTVLNKNAKEQSIELNYLTGGLGWKADYVAELAAGDKTINLSGWVTLNNTSGTSYKNAKLQLVAGDVNQVSRSLQKRQFRTHATDALGAAPARMQEEALLDYHLYSLERNTTIADNQTKQVSLLTANNIQAEKTMVLRGSPSYYQRPLRYHAQKLKVSVYVEFDNDTKSNLGFPLPKGVMRVYKKDKQGGTQFIGEDAIDHTAKDEKLKVKLGKAFDVYAYKKQTDFKVLRKSKDGNIYESEYELVLHNAKKEPVSVSVIEPIGGDWHVINENMKHKKINSHNAKWVVSIPAESKSALTYRVQTKY